MEVIVVGYYLGIIKEDGSNASYYGFDVGDKAPVLIPVEKYEFDIWFKMVRVPKGYYTRISESGDYCKVEVDPELYRTPMTVKLPLKQKPKALRRSKEKNIMPVNYEIVCPRCEKAFMFTSYGLSYNDGTHIFCKPCRYYERCRRSFRRNEAKKVEYHPMFDEYPSLYESDSEYIRRILCLK